MESGDIKQTSLLPQGIGPILAILFRFFQFPATKPFLLFDFLIFWNALWALN